MNNSKQIGIAVAALIVGLAGGFFGGMKYQQKKGGILTPANLQNLTQAQRQQLFAQGGGGQGGRRGAGGAGNNFTAGQILSKDDKSITIAQMGGGSKIVYLAPSSQISKSATGTPSDLLVGEQVTVMGTPNSDGSVTAQNVQIRNGAAIGLPQGAGQRQQ